LNWLAQYILRQHPKHVRTPRRRKMYEEFSGWANAERGRREILRRRAAIHKVFQGFEYNRRLQKTDYTRLFDALDERFHLHGHLKDNPLLNLKMFEKQMGPSCDFDQFWGWFLRLILRNDVIQYDILARGEKEIEDAALARRREEEEKKRKLEVARLKQIEEDIWWSTIQALVEEVRKNSELQKLFANPDMMLTGVDRVQKDEIPPAGIHVYILTELLRVLNFPIAEVDKSMKESCVWDNDYALAWEAWQEFNSYDLIDGVVEEVSLKEFLALCENRDRALNLKRIAPTIFAARQENQKIELAELEAEEKALLEEEEAKPSLQELADIYGFTMARIEWLHDTFEGILGDKDDYPKNPSPLDKTKMCELMASLKPEMTRQEFEMYFTQIDTDGSGEIEFDEFVEWICTEEQSGGAVPIDIDEGDVTKPSFEKLAKRFNVPLRRIEAMHVLFCTYFEDGVVDGYPDDPLSLNKDQTRALAEEINPDITDEEFDAQFEWVDFDGSGQIEFDEFLDFLDHDTIKGDGTSTPEPEVGASDPAVDASANAPTEAVPHSDLGAEAVQESADLGDTPADIGEPVPNSDIGDMAADVGEPVPESDQPELFKQSDLPELPPQSDQPEPQKPVSIDSQSVEPAEPTPPADSDIKEGEAVQSIESDETLKESVDPADEAQNETPNPDPKPDTEQENA